MNGLRPALLLTAALACAGGCGDAAGSAGGENGGVPGDGKRTDPANDGPGVPLVDVAARKLEVRILEPRANSRIGGDAVLVRVATTADARGVRVGDTPATAVGASQRLFRVVMRGLKAGPLTITATATATATDADGATATHSITLLVDQTPPKLVLESPAEGLVTDSAEVLVRGRVVKTGPEGETVQVSVNGVRVKLDAGMFERQVKLLEGRPTEIEVLARDEAGNLDKIRRHVRRDAEAPVLTLLSPADGATVGGTVVEVQGTVDDTSVRVTVNRTRALVEPDKRFRVGLALPEGSHTVTATATDAAGNAVTETRRFVVDRTAPVLKILSPAADLITREESVQVQGRVDDPGVAHVQIGRADTPVENGSFSSRVQLREGENDLTVVALDAAGNRDEVPLRVVRDSRGPRLRIIQPLPGDVVTAPTIEVIGRTGEPLKKIELNGQPMAVTDDGRFRAAVVLAEGHNDLVVVAEDRAGNRAQLRIAVIRRRAAELRAPGYLLVPSGRFTMGRNDGTRDQGPEHDVHLAAYYIAPKEVTNAEYEKFVTWLAAELAAKRNPHRYCHPDEPANKVHVSRHRRDRHLGKPECPVVGVDWFDAYAFARWSGGRLPSEAEWERAAGWVAASNKARRYPWGDTFKPSAAVLDYKRRGPAAAGFTKSDKSPVGAFDMGGNVQEWTADWYRGAYVRPPTPAGRRNPMRYRLRYRMVRGASWRRGDPALADVTYRMIELPTTRRDDLGFRVCRTP